MHSGFRYILLFFLINLFLYFTPDKIGAQKKYDYLKAGIVQAQVILTVSESKRLIGKGVAGMSIVRNAYKEGMIIIARGTTNTYVAEEILGQTIEKGAFVSGRTYPVKGGRRLNPSSTRREIVIKNGIVMDDMIVEEAVKELKQGDVVIKGANALDYENRTAGVFLGSSSSGTTGKIMPYIVGSKVHLIIPVGLEKNVAGNVLKLTNRMREPFESLNSIPSMALLTGKIVTELEALNTLTGVSAFQSGAGGIGGAEGAVYLILRGKKEQVEKALKLVEEIQGEPPFVQ